MSFADPGQWMNNLFTQAVCWVLSRSSHLHFSKEHWRFPPQKQWEDKTTLQLSSWCPPPSNSLAMAAGVGGGHLAEDDTHWWPYPHPLCFIPRQVLRFVFFLQVCRLKGLRPFLRCFCTCWGVGPWWDFHANKCLEACPKHRGRVSWERLAGGGLHHLELKPSLPGWLFFHRLLQGKVAATQFCVALVLDSLCSAQPTLRDSVGYWGFFFRLIWKTSLIIHLPA